MNSSKKTKLLLLIGAILTVMVALYFGIKPHLSSGKITLVIDFGNGDKKVFYYDPSLSGDKSEKRAWSLLQQAAAISNLDLEAGNNFIPRRIDGLSSEAGDKKWNLYVNGSAQNVSPIEVIVKSSDEVLFKFE